MALVEDKHLDIQVVVVVDHKEAEAYHKASLFVEDKADYLEGKEQKVPVSFILPYAFNVDFDYFYDGIIN